MADRISIFISRMKKCGVEIELAGNVPWIYLRKVNGNSIKERYLANHGFTVAFLNSSNGVVFTDISEIFKIIRKYK